MQEDFPLTIQNFNDQMIDMETPLLLDVGRGAVSEEVISSIIFFPVSGKSLDPNVTSFALWNASIYFCEAYYFAGKPQTL